MNDNLNDPARKLSTTDIYLASTLIAIGFDLIDITYSNNKYVFNFYDDDSVNSKEGYILEDYTNMFWRGGIKVDAKLLFSCFKELKGRMYDYKREQNRRLSG